MPENKRSPEEQEKEAEDIAVERGNILSRFLARIQGAHARMSENLENLSPEATATWTKLKQTPFLRGVALTTEAVLGSEPGKPLNTKEALVKCAAAFCLTGVDLIKKRSGAENIFKGRTFQALGSIKDSLRERKAAPVIVKSTNAVVGFLERNRRWIDGYENHLEGLTEKVY